MSVLSDWSVQKKWTVLFGVWALHGLIALWQFMSLPADEGSFLFGLSLQRTVMVAALLLWVFVNAALIFFVIHKAPWLDKFLNRLSAKNIKDNLLILAFVAVLSRLFAGYVLGLLQQSGDFGYVAYVERLSPLVNLMTFVFAEIMAIIVFLNLRGLDLRKSIPERFPSRLLVVISVLSLVFLLIALTGLGVTAPYKGDWARGLPAVPLLEWQIALACLLCFGMIVFEKNEIKKIDLWISAAIWILTAAFWLSQPVVPNPSALDPIGPNYEIYPFIDAQVYDSHAQSILIGDGLGADEIPQRPIYIVFLALLHSLAGQNYDSVIFAQSLFLTFFPVLLYLFGTEFFGRPIGVSIALLAVLRDFTSNLVSPFTGNLSYSKLYLSEIPTAMFLILFLWIGLRWIKSGFPLFSGFLMGGILGAAMLIRTQVVVALPVLLFFALIVQPKKIMPIIKSALLAAFAIVLAISPWLWRSWQITGELMFDNPASQTANLALRYGRLMTEDVNILPLPGESDSTYNERMLAMAKEAIAFDPAGAAKALANSFLNHAVNNILLFPMRNNLQDTGQLWTPSQPFWQAWARVKNPSQAMLLGFYIFLLGLGLTTAWQKNGWLGFLPLGLNLAYNLWTSLALLSGQRFMLTMDWSVYLYYMIGLFTLLSAFLFALESGRSLILTWYEKNRFSFIQYETQLKIPQYVFVGILFLGIGLSLPLSEKIFPQKYPLESQEAMLNAVAAQTNIDTACFRKVVDDNQLTFARGRALYPRYYEAGFGESFTDAVGYKAVDEGRLVFEMIGQKKARIVFPLTKMPKFFPNASDVTLAFDDNGGMWFVLAKQGDTQAVYSSTLFDPAICK